MFIGVACCVVYEAGFCERGQIVTLIPIVRCPCVYLLGSTLLFRVVAFCC